MSDAREALEAATRLLAAAGIESARADAESLLAHELGTGRGRVQAIALTGGPVDPAVARPVRARSSSAAPTGSRCSTSRARAGFRTIELAVGPGVFVPRPETEVVAQLAIDAARGMEAPLVVDLGDRQRRDRPGGRRRGARRDGLRRRAEPGRARLGRAERGRARAAERPDRARATSPTRCPDLDGQVDVVVSNPPYIPDGMIPRDPEVRLHDPADALFGGPDGLDPMRAVVATAARLLRPAGFVVVEHGEHQGAEVRALFPDGDWHPAQTHRDLTDRDRATTTRRRRDPVHPGSCHWW